MSKPELDNLVKIKRLKAETPSRAEYTRMLDSARKRLVDAQNEDLDADSQFDLAYGAAHRFALAALRREGYRSTITGSRYFKRSPIPWASKRTPSAISRSTKAARRLTRVCSRTLSVAQKN